MAPTGHDALALITREPIGVVAAIVPWNFPLIMAAWKIGPALAAGNSFILKPSEKSPLTAIRIAALAAEAGLPDGVFNVLPGYGQTAGQALALHMDVDCIGFTGSTRTGKLMLQYSGQLEHEARVAGVRRQVAQHHSRRLPRSRPRRERGGRRQSSSTRARCARRRRGLIVEEPVRDEVLDRIVSASREMQPGDPLDAATRMGAIVDDVQLQTVLGYIESGRSEGAEVLAGGERTREETGGFYVQPTVFSRRAARNEDRARRNLRARAVGDHGQRCGGSRANRATGSNTVWRPPCGRATSHGAPDRARAARRAWST